MRKNNFLTKLKIASRYLLDSKHSSMVMTCENCGGALIIPISKGTAKPWIDNVIHADMTWTQFVQCEKCGAVCREVQLWNYAGDYTKLGGALWTMDLK